VDLQEEGALDEEILTGVQRIVIVACGTAYHAGLIGRYAIEEWARLPGRDGHRIRVPLPATQWSARETS